VGCFLLTVLAFFFGIATAITALLFLIGLFTAGKR
jgi:hypothetical protein